ncbi:N/A [soil metagenome]
MKINNSSDRFAADGVTGKSTAKSGGAAPSSKSSASSDKTKVEVSTLGGTLASLQSELSEPDFDAAKVDQIKQAMRDGQFQVDSGKVADKLIASVQDLLAGKSR